MTLLTFNDIGGPGVTTPGDGVYKLELIKNFTYTEDLAEISIVDCFPDLDSEYIVEFMFGSEVTTGRHVYVHPYFDGTERDDANAFTYAYGSINTGTSTSGSSDSVAGNGNIQLTAAVNNNAIVHGKIHMHNVDLTRIGEATNTPFMSFDVRNVYGTSALRTFGGVTIRNSDLDPFPNAITGLKFSPNTGSFGVFALPKSTGYLRCYKIVTGV